MRPGLCDEYPRLLVSMLTADGLVYRPVAYARCGADGGGNGRQNSDDHLNELLPKILLHNRFNLISN